MIGMMKCRHLLMKMVILSLKKSAGGVGWGCWHGRPRRARGCTAASGADGPDLARSLAPPHRPPTDPHPPASHLLPRPPRRTVRLYCEFTMAATVPGTARAAPARCQAACPAHPAPSAAHRRSPAARQPPANRLTATRSRVQAASDGAAGMDARDEHTEARPLEVRMARTSRAPWRPPPQPVTNRPPTHPQPTPNRPPTDRQPPPSPPTRPNRASIVSSQWRLRSRDGTFRSRAVPTRQVGPSRAVCCPSPLASRPPTTCFPL